MVSISFFFFFNDTATTEIYTLSLHDAQPVAHQRRIGGADGEETADQLLGGGTGAHARRRHPRAPRQHGARRHARLREEARAGGRGLSRSEEHTSELQSRLHLVCRLLL